MPKKQKTKRKLIGGGLFDAIFGSKYKPADFKGKTVEDVLKMKLPFSITADFFDTVGDAQIPTEVQEAIQFMADLNDRKKVFEKCYKDKMAKNKPAHSAIHPKPVPAPVPAPVPVEEEKPEQVVEEKENKSEPVEEVVDEEKKEEKEKKEPPPFMDGGRRSRRRRSTKKHRKHRSKKSYKNKK